MKNKKVDMEQENRQVDLIDKPANEYELAHERIMPSGFVLVNGIKHQVFTRNGRRVKNRLADIKKVNG